MAHSENTIDKIKVGTITYDIHDSQAYHGSNPVIFIGVTTSNISDGSTLNPITINSATVTAVSGNIVIKNGTAKEFLWTGNAWEEFGDESTWATKGSSTGGATASGSAAEAGGHTHSVSGSTGDAGGHTHSISPTTATYYTMSYSGGTLTITAATNVYTVTGVSATGSAGSHTHSISGSAASAGSHTHSVSVDSHTHEQK